MAKYLDLNGLTAYDEKIKSYIAENAGGSNMWELVYSGSIPGGSFVAPATIGISNSSYSKSFKIVSSMYFNLAVPSSNADSNLLASKYNLAEGTVEAQAGIVTKTETSTNTEYKVLGSYGMFGPETDIDYSRTWQDIIQAKGWAYDASPLRKNYYAGKVTASAVDSARLYFPSTNTDIKVYSLVTAL